MFLVGSSFEQAVLTSAVLFRFSCNKSLGGHADHMQWVECESLTLERKTLFMCVPNTGRKNVLGY